MFLTLVNYRYVHGIDIFLPLLLAWINTFRFSRIAKTFDENLRKITVIFIVAVEVVGLLEMLSSTNKITYRLA